MSLVFFSTLPNNTETLKLPGLYKSPAVTIAHKDMHTHTRTYTVERIVYADKERRKQNVSYEIEIPEKYCRARGERATERWHIIRDKSNIKAENEWKIIREYWEESVRVRACVCARELLNRIPRTGIVERDLQKLH